MPKKITNQSIPSIIFFFPLFLFAVSILLTGRPKPARDKIPGIDSKTSTQVCDIAASAVIKVMDAKIIPSKMEADFSGKNSNRFLPETYETGNVFNYTI